MKMTLAAESTIRSREVKEAALHNRVAPRWEPLRVLLVEDSPIIREHLIEAIATSNRIKVIGYADTESQAVEALQQSECDVIILDLGLAEGSGLQVLKSARSEIDYSPVVVVFTNYTHPNSRKQMMKLGADYFLSKTEDFERLRRIMQGLASPQDLEED
jgi:DNA-binding NarL/FixJ family response regulator